MAKYHIGIHEFSFNKIKNGSRKVAVSLLDKQAQQLKIGDVLEVSNAKTGEKLSRKVKGVAIFDNFQDLVETLTPQALGYDNAEEVMVRLRRMYSPQQMADFNAVGFFLERPQARVRTLIREEIAREA